VTTITVCVGWLVGGWMDEFVLILTSSVVVLLEEEESAGASHQDRAVLCVGILGYQRQSTHPSLKADL